MTRWFDHVRDLTMRLVRQPSVTNSAGETHFGQHLYALLAEQPYFQRHPAHLRLERTTDDLHERYNVYALVRGLGSATVVLAGHYDVVGVDNYGQLAPWAFDPPALLPRLVAELRAQGHSHGDRIALHELSSGEYLPGRGVLDMKSGIAAGIAVLNHFAQRPDVRGNLLLVATPDEEEASHGMRAAVQQLPGLAREWQLELQAAINLDANGDRDDGGAGRAVFLGSVGKLLPSVLLVGRETHAGSPFEGVNANLLAAEVTRRIECNAALADSAEGAITPPPVSLKQADLKTHYDVTTPQAAWCYYNVLTHRRTAAEVLALMVGEVQAALAEALDHLAEQGRRYAELTGQPAQSRDWQPLVLTFAELVKRVRQQHGTAINDALAELGRTFGADPAIDLPEYSRRVVEHVWSLGGLSGPAAVVSFGSLYYPPAYVAGTDARQARLRQAAITHAQAVGTASGMPIRVRPFFPGISDMSFLGSIPPSDDVAAMVANTPAFGTRLRFDYSAIAVLNLPTINVGPWGRDYHQRTERVHMPYSFGVVPELVWRIAHDLLHPGDPPGSSGPTTD